MEDNARLLLLGLGVVFVIAGIVDAIFHRQMGDLAKRIVDRIPESFIEDMFPVDPRGYNFRRGALISGVLFSIFGSAYVWVILAIL
ncbi:hypothetical protein [Promicromonospora sp. NPDC023987]|uniref:hypothetical protein n=1 Tax=Promicromonospora sp. NPDC023987 TaxID=3155360 RepID=UPI0033CB0F74